MDPFDTAGADIPGTGQSNLGAMVQSPSFWQNLASFGANLSMAANARNGQGFLTYGNGFAGPLGAATQETMADAQRNAAVRSQLASQGAQTQGQELQNERLGLEMPYLRALSRMQAGMIGQMSGGLPLASGAPQSDYSFLGGPTQSTPASETQTADNTPQPSVVSNQPLIVDPKKRQSLLASAVAGTPVPPELVDGVVSEESGWNANARNPKSGAFGLGGVLPSTAADPGFGMAPVKMTDLANPANALKFTAQYLYNRGKAMGMTDQDWSDPAKVAAVAAAYHGPATDANGVNGAQYAAAIGARLKSGPSWEVAQNGGTAMPRADAAATAQTSAVPQFPGMPTPAQAYQLANQYRQQAFAMRMAGFDGSAYEQAANQYMQYALSGPTAAAQGWAKAAPELYVQQNQPRTLRGQGSALVVPGHPEQTVQVPMEVHGVDPNGKPYTYFVNPLDQASGHPLAPLPGNPPSAPPGTIMSVPSGQSPGTQEIMKGLGEEYNEEGKKTYLSAVNTLGWAESMRHSIDGLGANGMLAMGTDANARAEFAKHINTLSQIAGISPPFDTNKIADWESFNKYTKLAGMQVVNQFFGGSREAASIINSATSAVPNSENTPVGAKLVLDGITESAKNIIDRRTFETNWAKTHDGNLIGADVAFNKERPAQMYTRRAISQVQPYPVKTPADLKRFLPGTLVRLPNGNVVSVLGDQDLKLSAQ